MIALIEPLRGLVEGAIFFAIAFSIVIVAPFAAAIRRTSGPVRVYLMGSATYVLGTVIVLGETGARIYLRHLSHAPIGWESWTALTGAGTMCLGAGVMLRYIGRWGTPAEQVEDMERTTTEREARAHREAAEILIREGVRRETDEIARGREEGEKRWTD